MYEQKCERGHVIGILGCPCKYRVAGKPDSSAPAADEVAEKKADEKAKRQHGGQSAVMFPGQ